VFSNRANAFCKLMAWEQALKDCDEAIRLDKDFVKPYIRKGKIYQALQQYHKALQCYRHAAKMDPKNNDLLSAKQELMMAVHKRNSSGEIDDKVRQRALEDPDVQAALNDAEVSSVLVQAKSGDPSILFKAMRDRPHIAEKIETLMAAGVLQVQ